MRALRQFAFIAVLMALSLVFAERASGQSLPLRGEDLLEEARPHLEAVLGVRLQRLPPTRAVSSAEFATLADAFLDRELALRLGDIDAKGQARIKAVVLRSLRGAMVAGHCEGEEAIRFAPANALAIAGCDKSLAGTRLRTLLRLALVNEVVRLELERRYDLPTRRAACREPEELFALQALVEGQAQYLTRAVARKLGDEETLPVLAEAFRFVPDRDGDGTSRVVSRQVTAQRRWAYLHGLAFFDTLEGAGMKDSETRAFTRPPKLTAWIDQPELFARAEKLGLSDLSNTLTRLSGALPAKQWDTVQQPWTVAMIEQTANLLLETAIRSDHAAMVENKRQNNTPAAMDEWTRSERATKGWEAGRSLTWSDRDDPGRRVTVGIVRFSDEESAKAYYGMAVDLQRKQDELLVAPTGGARPTLLETKSSAASLTGFEEATRADRKVQLGERSTLAVTQFLARTDNRVIELTFHGVPADDDWGRRIFESIRQEK
jgi:hypothetical protein